MRTLFRYLAIFALANAVWSAESPAPATPATTQTPDVLATSWAQALKRNELSSAYSLLTQADQDAVANLWRRQMARPDAYADLQLDTVLRLSRNDTAADQLLAMSQPYLAQIDVPMLLKGINEVAAFLGSAAELQPAGTSSGLDYAGLRTWLLDLAAWLPGVGLTDQVKAKAAAGHLVRAMVASGLTSAAEIRALPLGELIKRIDPALPALKDALLVYDVQIDALLSSFKATLSEAGPDQATIALNFLLLNKPRTITLKLVKKNGTWELASGNDNPITGLSQLVMTMMVMQNFGGGATTPATPTPVPEDDGAL